MGKLADILRSCTRDSSVGRAEDCNELPAVRRVDGVCVCAKEDETRFDGTRSFDMYFERSLSLVVEVTVREEE